jgi:hypothetical protein
MGNDTAGRFAATTIRAAPLVRVVARRGTKTAFRSVQKQLLAACLETMPQSTI